MKRLVQIILFIIIGFGFAGCAPKKLFPTDRTVYDKIENYHYNYTKHTILSSDKSNIDALYIKTSVKSKGLVVVANGIYKNLSFRFTQWLWIVDSGYDVFIFDYRGFGDSDEFVDLFSFRNDVNSAVEYAHHLDPKQSITLVGQSMGGSFVIDALALQDYDYVSLAVSDSTFSNFDDTLSLFMMKTVLLLPFAWLPYTFTPTELNSINNIAEVKRPILFITGDSDWVIDDVNSQKLFQKAHNEKALWIVKDAGHVESLEIPKVQKAFLEILTNPELLSHEKVRYF